MKKFGIQVVALVILIIVATFVIFRTNLAVVNMDKTSSGGETGQSSAITAVKIGDTTVPVEVADTESKRDLGLGGRQSLASDSGMLFVFDNPDKYQFWMKDMQFGLDFIWIDGASVVDVLPDIPAPAPGTPDSQLTIYGPTSPVDKVLEVNRGFASSHGIRVGDSVEFVTSSQ